MARRLPWFLLTAILCVSGLRSDAYTAREKASLQEALAARFECSSLFDSTVSETSERHLVALVSGYRGSVASLKGLAEGLCSASFAKKEPTLIVVLDAVAGAQSVQPVLVQGERVADQVMKVVEAERRISSYSIIGHSLGGIVARVAASRLDSLGSDRLRPRLFVSLFSPHAGMESFVNSKLLPSLIRISQTDRGVMDELCEQDPAKSILVNISRGHYRQVLEKFQKRVLYSSDSDWLVDFGSGAITTDTPPEDGLEADEAVPADQEYADQEYPSLGLHSRNFSSDSGACHAHSVRCEVMRELQHVPFVRVSARWELFRPDKHSFKDMGVLEKSELLRHLTKEFGGTNANLPRGERCVSSEFCAVGLVCSGVCQPRVFQASDACDKAAKAEADGERLEMCSFAVDLLNDALQAWFLVVTSSGGGGHLVAAQNLQRKLLEQAEGGYILAAQALQQNKALFTPEAYNLAKEALSAVQNGPPAVAMLDMMKIPCTSLDGMGYIPLGGFMTDQWNTLQASGDIEGLRRLVAAQPLTQWVFGRQCRDFMKSVIRHKQLGYQRPAKRVVSTQPLLIQSLLDASDAGGLDLYMTDLPTEEAVHFFGPLVALGGTSSTIEKRLFLHGVSPMQGGEAELERLSGIPRRQIIIDKFMPIDPSFTSGSLPSPGQAVAIRLKAQIPLEEDFLAASSASGPVTNPILLEEDDELLMVMLGSQPTVEAVLTYAKESLKLPDLSTGKRYVFLACGRPRSPAYKRLYEDIVSLSRSLSSMSSRTILVPFTGQRAAEILGRADITITRSGGLTAGELLALHRGDKRKKHILLHVEAVDDDAKTRALAALPDMPDMSEDQAAELAADNAALVGMVPWEAGNARYLQQVVGARIVTPESLVRTLLDQKQLPFPVNWRLFLHLRGFSAAAIDLAEECNCSYSFHRSRPLTHASLSGDNVCRTALEAFAGEAIPCNQTTIVSWYGMDLFQMLYNLTDLAQNVATSCNGTLFTRGRFVAVQL